MMKVLRTFFALMAILTVFGCANTAKVTPMANTEPIRISNVATRKSISESQTHSKQGQIILKEQGTNLDKASDILSQLLKK